MEKRDLIVTGILLLSVLCGCASPVWNVSESLPLTDEQVEEILQNVPVMIVSQNQINGACPIVAASYMRSGMTLAECTKHNPSRIYIVDSVNLHEARRHAASHIYDVQVRGLTPEESGRHLNW